MFEQLPDHQTIEKIFRNNLKIETYTMDIDGLNSARVRDRITYDPYYQRNYVWSNEKASYFIESILLGTEIPPLIFYKRDGRFEVVDGRQRFQTVDRFIKGEFRLSRKGLKSLKSLAQKRYEDLPHTVKSTFMDTTLRVIEIEVVAVDDISEVHEDLVKKEIFRRYNSGITPLRKYEIQKAEYIEDEITVYFSNKLETDKETYKAIVGIFMSDRQQSRLEDPRLLPETMVLVRELLVFHEVPIKYYQTPNGKETARIIYENMSGNEDAEEIYSGFVQKLHILKSLRPNVSTENPSYNRHLYKVLYWSLAILEKEGRDSSEVTSPSVVSKLGDHLSRHSDIYDTELTEIFWTKIIDRYQVTADFFSEIFDLNLSEIYVENRRRVSIDQHRSSEPPTQLIQDFTDLRLNKPDAQTITVDNLNSRMQRGHFLVRPAYQRYESNSRGQASSIIESMLLGIKLPPIFVFRRNDGITEVIDGQQRILSVFGFMKLKFQDERGRMVSSDKDGFRLTNLRVLKEFNGKSFDNLDAQIKDKLWDFTLYQVIINEKVNPEFHAVDLFIRLNYKPYPINPNSFEMWNSFADRDSIQKIKSLAAAHSGWFYLRADNRRMDNEELITTLAYFSFYNKKATLKDVLEIYPDRGRIYLRVKSKPDLTKLLGSLSDKHQAKEAFSAAIKLVESSIRKVKSLLIDTNVEEDVSSWLKSELEKLFGVERRSKYLFYALWFVLLEVNLSMIHSRKTELKPQISQLMKFVRDTSEVDESEAITLFYKKVDCIWSQHSPSKRRLKLSQADIARRITSQGNKCPICDAEVFVGEDVEADHIKPISVGGSDTLDNIQIVHPSCNRQKRNESD